MLDRYSSISISLERGWEQPTVCHHVRTTYSTKNTDYGSGSLPGTEGGELLEIIIGWNP